MGFLRKVKKKIEEGRLTEWKREAGLVWAAVVRYRGAVLVRILLGTAGIALSLGTSVASKFLIDAVTGHKTGIIGAAAAGMAGMMLGHILLKSASSRISAVMQIRIQNEMQADVYSRVLLGDWESVAGFRSGDLLHRLLSDVGTVASGVTGFVPGALANLVQFFGAFAIMLVYDPVMAALALLSVPAAALSSHALIRRMRRYNRRMKDVSAQVTSFLEDSLSNLTGIQALGAAEDFTGRMQSMQDGYREEYLRCNRFNVLTSAGVSLLGMLTAGACFSWGVYRLWSGALSFGEMTMFLQLVSFLRGAFSGLLGLASSAVSILTSAGRVLEITAIPADLADETGENGAPEDSEAAISAELPPDFGNRPDLTVCLEQVSFCYKNGKPVLRQVDFTARPGELVALTGPSGEGKTTVLRLLLGLIRPETGRAVLCAGGEEILLTAASRTLFSYVPQGNRLFEGTVADNLRLTRPEATEQELWEVLHIACADFVEQLPGGLYAPVGGRDSGLSEGQAQRICVARALLRKAPVLLLDEATSALDEDTEERMLRHLMDSGRVRTCIVVTHRPGPMRFCTRQFRMEGGICQPCETGRGEDT